MDSLPTVGSNVVLILGADIGRGRGTGSDLTGSQQNPHLTLKHIFWFFQNTLASVHTAANENSVQYGKTGEWEGNVEQQKPTKRTVTPA